MTYSELLSAQEWQDRRNEVLQRDSHLCQKCFNLSYLTTKNFSPFLNLKTGTEHLYRVRGFQLETGKIIGGFFNISFNPDLEIILKEKKENRTLISFSLNADSIVVEAIFELPFKIKQEHPCLRWDTKNPSINDQKLRLRLKLKLIEEIEKRIFEIKWYYVRGLHVHHKYYKINTLPWEYDDQALKTYCLDCHEKIHKNQKIKLLDSKGKIITNLTPCKRCHGAGWIPKYSHVENGICFKCYGAKYYEFIDNEDYL